MTGGIEAFHRGEFEACIRVLEAAIPGLADPHTRAEARLFVGLAQAVLGSVLKARVSFREALLDDPEIAPDERRVPPEIVAAFEHTRRNVTGRLEVEANGAATVFVDDVEARPVPFASNVGVGRHQVRVVSVDRRAEARHDVLIRAGQKTRLEATLQLRPGALTLISTPAGADVWLGGQHLGRTPLEALSLPAGPIEVVVRLPRHFDQKVPLLIRPGETTRFEVPLREQYVRESFGEVSMFGPDLREGVDRWSIVGLSSAGGLAPLSTSVETSFGFPKVVSGGFGAAFEFGFAIFDLVELTGVIGFDTFGVNAAYFEKLRPTTGPTFLTLGPGRGRSAFSLSAFRAGLHGRLVLARFWRLRLFGGVGYYALPAIAEVQHVGYNTSRSANDGFRLHAGLGGTSIAPSAGLKITLFEGEFRENYVAVDVMVEGRLEFLRYDAKIEATFDSAAGEARANQALPLWQQPIGTEPAATAAGLIIGFGARI